MKKLLYPSVLVGLFFAGLFLSCDLGGGSSAAAGTTSFEVRFGEAVLGADYSHDAGPIFPGENSAAQTFTLRNTGTADINLGAVTVSGPNASAFPLSGPGVSTLAPGKETTFSLTFSPATPGVKTATVGVSAAAPPRPSPTPSTSGARPLLSR